MSKQVGSDRATPFLEKKLETMPYKKRLEYLNQRLSEIIQYAESPPYTSLKRIARNF